MHVKLPFKIILKTFIFSLSVNITLQLLVCELNFMDVWYISVVSDLGFWKGAIKNKMY